MRRIGGMLAGVVLATSALAGCSQGSGATSPLDIDPKAVEGQVAKLLAAPFKGKATSAADLEPLRVLVPPDVQVTWGEISFDAAVNATLITDLKVTPKDTPTAGVQISELRLWDLDTDLLKARLSGQRLSESAPLARRIEAKGTSLFGMAAMMNAMGGFGGAPAEISQPLTPGTEVAPNWPSETEPSLEFDGSAYSTTIERYDFSYDTIVVDDVVLRPYDVVAVAANPGVPDMFGMQGEGAKINRQIISAYHSVGVDTFAATGMKADLVMNEMGQKVTMAFGAKSMGTRGMRGGDADASYARGVTYSFGFDDSPSGIIPAFDAAWTVDFLGVKDMRFDKLYGYLAKGVTPPRTETDLMSFGTFRMENQTVKLGDREIITVGESILEARKFHWFIPTEMKASTKDAVIDVGAIMNMLDAAAPAAQSAAPPGSGADGSPEFGMAEQSRPDFAAIAPALQKNGLSKPKLNGNFSWNWNASSGDTKLGLGFGGEALMQIDFRYEGGLPSFQAASSLIPDDPEKADALALGKLFDEKSTLKLIDLSIADQGGLTKIFGLTADIGAALAAANPSEPNPMAGQTGASLRQMAGGLITMVGASPDIAPFMTPFAAFVTEGGKLHASLAPSTTLPWSGVGAKFTSGTSSPGQVLKELGLKVEHTK